MYVLEKAYNKILISITFIFIIMVVDTTRVTLIIYFLEFVVHSLVGEVDKSLVSHKSGDLYSSIDTSKYGIELSNRPQAIP